VRSGSRREVVRGPAVRLLDFDEELETLWLSTGTPKSDAKLLGTCFLLVDGNRVSDAIAVHTADHVELSVKLSYRVSFNSKPGADDARWFNVSNYVALLADHLGSIVRAAVRLTPIDRFHAASTEIIRSAILGEKKGEKRAGREFEENGMLVYDVEVLEVRIEDEEVELLLTDAQRTAIVSEVGRKKEALRLLDEEAKEAVNRAVFATQQQTAAAELELETAKRALSSARSEARAELARLDAVGKARAEAEALELSSTAQSTAQERRAQVTRRDLSAQVEAFEAQMAALHPELIATLKALGNQQLAQSLTANLSPLAILGGDSVADVASRLLASLPAGPDGADLVAKVLPAKKKSA